VVVSSDDDKGKTIVVNSIGKTLDGKRGNYMNMHKSFKTLGPFGYHGQN
jgi:hypothetical protein